MEKLLFTSESVTEGHPDKMCDAISDAILDACMEQDPMSRVACEAASCTGFVLVTGEITTNAYVDIPKIVRETVKEIGYDKSEYGFDGNTCAVMVSIDEQSSDIAMGVDKALEAKENQMISLAMDCAERQMMEGTASSQVITHFLKLGSGKERLEREKLEEENKLLRAKTKALEESAESKIMYEEVLRAMRDYSGAGDPDEY